jgi:Uma2 family endonuclease
MIRMESLSVISMMQPAAIGAGTRAPSSDTAAGMSSSSSSPGLASDRNPDLAVVLRDAPKDWRGRRIAVLAAEVVLRGSVERDYVTKREEYLAYGLLEYWIVDPLERKVSVLTRRGDTWSEAVFRNDQVIVSLVLPGFATTVAELWVDVEDADDDDAAAPAANGA